MKFGHILLFLTAFTLAFGAVPAKQAPPAKKAPQAKKGSVATRKAAPRPAGKTTARTTAAKKGARPVAGASRSRQQTPTNDRYREIQQALADRGYLKSEPSGVWGPESVDALKQFQSSKNLQATGKLTSQSLIGLGLGPKTAGPLVMPSAPGVADSAPGQPQ